MATLAIQFVPLACPKCGTLFAVPLVWWRQRFTNTEADDTTVVSCPNGHQSTTAQMESAEVALQMATAE